MSAQLTLGLGTTHVCHDRGLPSWGCGQLWDCGQPDCLLGEHQLCPTCTPGRAVSHARVFLNRAKREQIVQVKLDAAMACLARARGVVPA